LVDQSIELSPFDSGDQVEAHQQSEYERKCYGDYIDGDGATGRGCGEVRHGGSPWLNLSSGSD
jgi:hypothetical protein